MDLIKTKRTVSTISIALLIICFFLLANVSKNSRNSEDLLRDNIMFATSKLDYELGRFIRILTLFGNERYGITSQQLHHQVDMLWSRLLVSSEGSTGRKIKAHQNASKSLADLKFALTQEQWALMTLDPANSAEINRLFERFVGLSNEIHAVNIRVLREEQALRVATAKNLNTTRQTLFVCIFAALVCALILFSIILLELRRSQKYARQNMSLMAVAQNFGLGVVATRIKEKQHIIEFYNARFSEYTGHGESDLRGQKLDSVLNFRAKAPDTIDLNNGGDQKIEFVTDTNTQDSGASIPMLFEYQNIEQFNQSSQHRIGVLRDITQQQEYENALIEAKEKAEAGSRAKSDFLATMSHEIRTPLNGMLGIMEIQKHEADTLRQHRFIDAALDSGLTLLEIVNNVLDFAKLDSSELEVVKTEFDLSRLLKNIEELFGPACIKKGLTLTPVIEPNTPVQLSGHASILNQLLFNLVSNAIKFSNSGEIKVTASTTARDDDLLLQICVSDEGPGLPTDLSEKIFEPFFQVNGIEGTLGHESGTGLGLAICRKLAQRIKGSIELVTSTSTGSTFRIQLPVGRASTQLDAAYRTDSATIFSDVNKRDHDSNAFADLKILVAEDSKVNQLVAVSFLKSLGSSVTLAVDGAEAVRLVSQQRFDIVFMDIRMPGRDGRSATHAIRQLPYDWNDLPIIALTADAIGSERDMCLQAGMNDYVVKPYTRNQLIDIINKWASFAKWEQSDPSHLTPICESPLKQGACKLANDDYGGNTINSNGVSSSAISRVSEFPVKHFDIDTLKQLEQNLSPENLHETLQIFLDDAGERIAAISNSIDAYALHGSASDDESDSIRMQLHTLIGEADTFGARNLSRIAIELQKMHKQLEANQNHARSAQSNNQLRNEFSATAALLRRAHDDISQTIRPEPCETYNPPQDSEAIFASV